MKRLHAYQYSPGSPWMTIPASLSAAAVWRFIRLGSWHALAWEVGETLEIEVRNG